MSRFTHAILLISILFSFINSFHYSKYAKLYHRELGAQRIKRRHLANTSVIHQNTKRQLSLKMIRRSLSRTKTLMSSTRSLMDRIRLLAKKESHKRELYTKKTHLRQLRKKHSRSLNTDPVDDTNHDDEEHKSDSYFKHNPVADHMKNLLIFQVWEMKEHMKYIMHMASLDRATLSEEDQAKLKEEEDNFRVKIHHHYEIFNTLNQNNFTGHFVNVQINAQAGGKNNTAINQKSEHKLVIKLGKRRSR